MLLISAQVRVAFVAQLTQLFQQLLFAVIAISQFLDDEAQLAAPHVAFEQPALVHEVVALLISEQVQPIDEQVQLIALILQLEDEPSLLDVAVLIFDGP